jgi:hypothetical protein
MNIYLASFASKAENTGLCCIAARALERLDRVTYAASSLITLRQLTEVFNEL